MTASPLPKTSRERTRAYRERKRAQGMRLVSFWVPDVNSESFKAEARRQSLLIANSPREAEDQAWVESIAIDPFEDD